MEENKIEGCSVCGNEKNKDIGSLKDIFPATTEEEIRSIGCAPIKFMCPECLQYVINMKICNAM